MRPRSGLLTPAMALMMLVLPEPERPNSAITGAFEANVACNVNAPKRCSTSTLSMMIRFTIEPF